MKDTGSRLPPEIRPTGYLIPFNQQATDNLLRQLQIAMVDVEEVIRRSKQSLGIKHDNNQVNDVAHTRDLSDINFHISAEQADSLSVRDQLTYSASLPASSQVRKSAMELINVKSSEIIYKRLNYDQDQTHTVDRTSQEMVQRTQNYSPINRTRNSKLTQLNQTQKPNKSPYKIQQKQVEHQEQGAPQQPQIQKRHLNLPGTIQNSIMYFSHQKHTEFTTNNQRDLIQDSYNKSRLKRAKIFTEKNSTFQQKRQNTDINHKIQQQIKDSKDNTCSKNQMQNILMNNYSSKKNREERSELRQRQLELLNSEFSKMKQRIEKNRLQSSRNRVKTSITSNTHTPKSKSPINKSSPPKESSRSPTKRAGEKLSLLKQEQYKKSAKIIKLNPSTAKKSPYPKKHIENLDNKQTKSGFSPPPNKSIHTLKYSHPTKSPQKKKNLALELQEQKRSCPQPGNKQQFINKMLEQCYVRRFLSLDELSIIYEQFCSKKVPRYQWEQRVIQKIFLKIHQVDEII